MNPRIHISEHPPNSIGALLEAAGDAINALALPLVLLGCGLLVLAAYRRFWRTE